MKASDFNNLILPIRQKIFRLSRRLLVSSDSAEDATQDILLKLWNKKGSLKNIKNVEAFAMTMTKNHCLDQLKLKSSQNLRLVHSNFESESADPHRQMQAKEEWERVEELMKQLPEAQQMVCTLERLKATIMIKFVK